MEFKEIIEGIKKGGTVLYPTDTTFGLGCDATDSAAIERLKQLKGRPEAKSFIILVENERRLQDLVDVSSLAWDIMDFSQKPVTLIYDSPRGLPAELLAEDQSIGIRLTDDPFCKKIISGINAPLVSTSANLSGQPSPKSFSEISEEIRKGVDYIFEECKTFVPKYSASSVIKLDSDGRVKVIRE